MRKTRREDRIGAKAAGRRTQAALVLWLCVATGVACGRGETRSASAETVQPASGPVAVRRLLQDVATALCQQDRDRLLAVLVTEDEYRNVILPGSVPVGEPLVTMPPAKAEYFTRLHRTKSAYALAALMAACPMGSLKFEEVELPDKVEQRAGYTLYRDPKLRFRDAQGETVELEPGSVVEFSGQVKMLSYYRD